MRSRFRGGQEAVLSTVQGTIPSRAGREPSTAPCLSKWPWETMMNDLENTVQDGEEGPCKDRSPTGPSGIRSWRATFPNDIDEAAPFWGLSNGSRLTTVRVG